MTLGMTPGVFFTSGRCHDDQAAHHREGGRESLRLHYQVVLRLAKRGRSQRIGGRFVVDRSDLPRVRREHPWRADAQRSFK